VAIFFMEKRKSDTLLGIAACVGRRLAIPSSPADFSRLSRALPRVLPRWSSQAAGLGKSQI
jgi:hypothetical protein